MDDFDFSDFDIPKFGKEDYETDQDYIYAEAALLEAESILSNIETQRKAHEVVYDELASKRQALEKQLAEVAQEMTRLSAVARDFRQSEWNANDRKTRAAKSIEQIKENYRVRYEGKKKLASFEETAKQHKWYTGITFPDGETYKILEQQFIGAQFLATSQRCILGDGMGTGKTIQAIAALDLVEANKVLIVCQADITTNFNDEVRRWSDRPVVNMRGMDKLQRNLLLDTVPLMDKVTVIVNYESWRKDLSLLERLISVGFDTVVIDEAHNLKDTASVAYRGIKQICHTINICPRCSIVMPAMIDVNGKVVKNALRQCTTCGWQGEHYEVEGINSDSMTWEEYEDYKFWALRSVKRIWPMTGTPILNKPQDIFALLSLIDPRRFDNKNQFLREYCQQDYYTGRWQFRSGGADSLFLRLKGKYLARTMEEMGITLPPQYPVIHDIDFDKEMYPLQAEVIKQISESAEIVMNSGKTIPILAQIAVITRQRQANVWPGGIEWKILDSNGNIMEIVRVSEEVQESIKIDKACQIIIEGIERGERIVLFSQFKTSLVELHLRLNDSVTEDNKTIRTVIFDGETPQDLRTEIKRNFDKKNGEDAKWDVVLAHYKVGGTGLNFTECTRTIILDEEWNPGKRDQAYARTARIGQDQTTFVDVLRLNKTVDTWLAGLIQEKQDMIGGFNESADDMQSSWIDAFKNGDFTG